MPSATRAPSTSTNLDTAMMFPDRDASDHHPRMVALAHSSPAHAGEHADGFVDVVAAEKHRREHVAEFLLADA